MLARLCALFAVTLALVACGGDDGSAAEGMLLDGSLTAEFDGETFTPEFGFATIDEYTPLIAVGGESVQCGAEQQQYGPIGKYAIIWIDALEPGDYTSQMVEVYRNEGDYEGVGSTAGTVTLTSAEGGSVAGSVQYAYTDDNGRHFALSGTFEVMRCPNR